VVVQFAVSSVLLIGTAAIYSQVQYMQTKDLGFDGEQTVVFNLGTNEAWNVQDALRQEALAHPAVLQASTASAVPSQFGTIELSSRGGYSGDAVGEADENMLVHPARVDAHYIETLGLRMAAGRPFDPELSTDAQRAFVINETAARELGWTAEEAVGKSFSMQTDGEVIGVVEDFHIGSLQGEIPAVVLYTFPPARVGPMSLVARLAPEDIPGAMRHLEASVRPFAREGPLAYAFLDERFQALYEAELRLGRIFSAFAGLAILVAALGLFGLAAFAAQARTKEIGVRKVLGASVASIVGLLSKDFLKLVAVAFVIAAPVAYWGMTRWLEDFAYRIELGPGLFAWAAAVALVVTFVTVAYHGIRAATSNPVKALRTE
jgi:putative ABC transport system permease protein